MNHHHITIYTLPTCEYCKLAKEYLTRLDVPFESIDVSQNEAAQTEMIEKSGQTATPVIDVDGRIVVGFQKDLLDALLGISEEVA